MAEFDRQRTERCIMCMEPAHPGQSCADARILRQHAEKIIMQNDAGIHPAPSEFNKAQLDVDPILHFFHYAHLPEKLKGTSRLFFILASTLVTTLPRNAERTVALRKLLEAKDAAVRANLPAPGFGNTTHGASTGPELGEPVEIGGHDEDRDGPVKFGD